MNPFYLEECAKQIQLSIGNGHDSLFILHVVSSRYTGSLLYFPCCQFMLPTKVKKKKVLHGVRFYYVCYNPHKDKKVFY